MLWFGCCAAHHGLAVFGEEVRIQGQRFPGDLPAESRDVLSAALLYFSLQLLLVRDEHLHVHVHVHVHACVWACADERESVRVHVCVRM